jgi:hypothetical protein
MRRLVMTLLLAVLASACTTLPTNEPQIDHWRQLPLTGYGDD